MAAHSPRPRTQPTSAPSTTCFASPAAFARHIRNEQNNKQMGVNLLKLMPDAMLWSYAPGQPQLPNQPTAVPRWLSSTSSPTRVVAANHGIRAAHRPRRPRLDRPAHPAPWSAWKAASRAPSTSAGALSPIFIPAGTVTLQQANVGGQRWIVEHIVEQLNLRRCCSKTSISASSSTPRTTNPSPPCPTSKPSRYCSTPRSPLIDAHQSSNCNRPSA